MSAGRFIVDVAKGVAPVVVGLVAAVSIATPASAEWYDSSLLPPADIAAPAGVPTIAWQPKISAVALHPDTSRLRVGFASGIAPFIRDPYGSPMSYGGLSGTRLLHQGAGPWDQDSTVIIDRGAGFDPQYVAYAAMHGTNSFHTTIAPFAFDLGYVGNPGACAGTLQGGAGHPDYDDCLREGGPSAAARAFWQGFVIDPWGSGSIPRWRIMDDGMWHVFSPDNTFFGGAWGFPGVWVEPGTTPSYDYAHWARGITMRQSTNHTWFGNAGAVPPPGGTATPPADVTGTCDPSPTGDLGAQPSMLVRTLASPSQVLSYALPTPVADAPPAGAVSNTFVGLTATVVDGSDYGGSASVTGTTLSYQPDYWRRMSSAAGPVGREPLMGSNPDRLVVRWSGTLVTTDAGGLTTSVPWTDDQNVAVAVCPRVPTPNTPQTMLVPGDPTVHDLLSSPNDDQVWDDNSLVVRLDPQPATGWRIGIYESPTPVPGTGDRSVNAPENPAGNTSGRFRFLPGRSIRTGTLTIGFTVTNLDGKLRAGSITINVTSATESPT